MQPLEFVFLLFTPWSNILASSRLLQYSYAVVRWVLGKGCSGRLCSSKRGFALVEIVPWRWVCVHESICLTDPTDVSNWKPMLRYQGKVLSAQNHVMFILGVYAWGTHLNTIH